MEYRMQFGEFRESESKAEVCATGADEARVVRPVRNQVQMVMQDLDASLSQDHPARAIWSA